MPEVTPVIAENVMAISAAGTPALIGGRDRQSGRIVFPAPADASLFEPILLPDRGRLWSWTVQRFRPKSPPYTGAAAFEPYAVGYIELPGAIIVESRLTDVPFDALRIGMSMRLVTLPFEQENGPVRTTFAFAPDRDMAK